MNTAILNQLFKGEPCNLAADRVKAGNGDGFGSIVNNKVTACQGFKAADIAAFTADDASFHLVVGEGDD